MKGHIIWKTVSRKGAMKVGLLSEIPLSVADAARTFAS